MRRAIPKIQCCSIFLSRQDLRCLCLGGGDAKEFSILGEEVGVFQREFHEVATNDFGLEVGTNVVSACKSAACCTSGGYEEFDPS